MSISHKFVEFSFLDGFHTHNAILDITPSYVPKRMIIGTFNPDTPKTNFADFFYGRNYLWPAFENLFEHNMVEIQGTRMPKNGKPKKPLNPPLPKILFYCKKLELTFSDLIIEVLHNENPDYHILDNDNVCFNRKTFNLIQDGKKGQIEGLEQLEKLNQIGWNTKNIIKYLCENSQLKEIYFTRKPTGIWAQHWEEIKNDKRLKDRNFTNIFTPSGQGKPVLNSMSRLLKHWVHNVDSKFGRLDRDWLAYNNVNLNNF